MYLLQFALLLVEEQKWHDGRIPTCNFCTDVIGRRRPVSDLVELPALLSELLLDGWK